MTMIAMSVHRTDEAAELSIEVEPPDAGAGWAGASVGFAPGFLVVSISRPRLLAKLAMPLA